MWANGLLVGWMINRW